MIGYKATRCLKSLPTIPIRLFSSPTTTGSSTTNTSNATIKSTTLSSSPDHMNNETQKPNQQASAKHSTTETTKKTMAQLDEELREKLEGRSGEGGVAGLEYEGGKAVAMKRGVRDNMFRFGKVI